MKYSTLDNLGGYVVTLLGIEVDEAKVHVIRSWPVRTTVAQSVELSWTCKILLSLCEKFQHHCGLIKQANEGRFVPPGEE